MTCKSFLVVITIYSILGIILFPHFKYQINPDAVSYISITWKYIHGDYSHAINGFWGPLLSWILIPIFLTGLPPLIAAKIVSLVIGVLSLVAISLLSKRFQMGNYIAFLVILATVPFILYCALSFTSPDLLLVFFLILYLNIAFNENYCNLPSRGILCGMFGGLAYLSKSYAFPFFLVHFPICNAIYFFINPSSDRRIIIQKNFITGLLFFAIISGPWIAAISYKYNKITMGTAGSFNYALANPDPIKFLNPSDGFIEPPNKTAVGPWEDVTYFGAIFWNPIQSWAHFKHLISIVSKNIYNTYLILVRFSPLSITIILSYIILLISPHLCSRPDLKERFLVPLTFFIYPTGYILLLIDERYIWILCILLILAGGYVIHFLFKNTLFYHPVIRSIVLFFFLISFIIIPLSDLYHDYQAYPGKYEYDVSKAINNFSPIHGNVASNGQFQKSLFLAYYSGCRYFGSSKPEMDTDTVISELKKKSIDYYFVWKESDTDCLSMRFSSYIEITSGRIKGLSIYKIK